VLATRLNDHQGSARDLPEQRRNGVPRDDRHDDVRHQDKGIKTRSSTAPDPATGDGLNWCPDVAGGAVSRFAESFFETRIFSGSLFGTATGIARAAKTAIDARARTTFLGNQ
jgi:hypothetical protein